MNDLCVFGDITGKFEDMLTFLIVASVACFLLLPYIFSSGTRGLNRLANYGGGCLTIGFELTSTQAIIARLYESARRYKVKIVTDKNGDIHRP